jgi:hypothetical protein
MQEEKGAPLFLLVGTDLLLFWLTLQASSCHRPITGTSNKTKVAGSPASRAWLMPGMAITT